MNLLFPIFVSPFTLIFTQLTYTAGRYSWHVQCFAICDKNFYPVVSCSRDD